jgi:hypothetical protein
VVGSGSVEAAVVYPREQPVARRSGRMMNGIEQTLRMHGLRLLRFADDFGGGATESSARARMERGLPVDVDQKTRVEPSVRILDGSNHGVLSDAGDRFSEIRQRPIPLSGPGVLAVRHR